MKGEVEAVEEGNEEGARREEREDGVSQRAAFERRPWRRAALLLLRGNTRVEESTRWKSWVGTGEEKLKRSALATSHLLPPLPPFSLPLSRIHT